MRRTTVAAALAVVLTGAAEEAQAPPAEDVQPQLVRKDVREPRDRIKRIHFTPDAQPAPARARQIIGIESVRWGVSAARLRCRVNGESTFQWNASNGAHRGFGQFKWSTYRRGVGTLVRRVSYRRVRSVVRRQLVVRTYSDGAVVKGKGRHRRVLRGRAYYGRLPRSPAWTHGWAQLRIMAQAMAGRSAVGDGEWEVRC